MKLEDIGVAALADASFCRPREHGKAPDVSPVHLKSAKFSGHGTVLVLAVDDGLAQM